MNRNVLFLALALLTFTGCSREEHRITLEELLLASKGGEVCFKYSGGPIKYYEGEYCLRSIK